MSWQATTCSAGSSPDFGAYCRQKQAPVLAVYDVGNLEQIKKFNAITFDNTGRITFFEEKPKNPTSTITGIALYYYPKATLPLIRQYIAEGNNPDQPGRLIQWLYPRTPGLYLARAGHLVRHRLQGNPRRSKPDIREDLLRSMS